MQRRNDRGCGGNLVYSDRGEEHASGSEDGKLFYVTDPHGNVVQLIDESGKVVKTYEYDSFGNEVNLDSKDDNPFRYCGEYYRGNVPEGEVLPAGEGEVPDEGYLYRGK